MSDTLSEKGKDFQIEEVDSQGENGELRAHEESFKAREKRLLRKIDWNLLPFLS